MWMRRTGPSYIALYKYKDVFPGMLPTRAPPNWKLGDIHEIPLIEGAKPIQKSMYLIQSLGIVTN